MRDPLTGRLAGKQPQFWKVTRSPSFEREAVERGHRLVVAAPVTRVQVIG